MHTNASNRQWQCWRHGTAWPHCKAWHSCTGLASAWIKGRQRSTCARGTAASSGQPASMPTPPALPSGAGVTANSIVSVAETGASRWRVGCACSSWSSHLLSAAGMKHWVLREAQQGVHSCVPLARLAPCTSAVAASADEAYPTTNHVEGSSCLCRPPPQPSSPVPAAWAPGRAAAASGRPARAPSAGERQPCGCPAAQQVARFARPPGLFARQGAVPVSGRCC